jgi:translation elongation factor EF-Tu-like GTPase
MGDSHDWEWAVEDAWTITGRGVVVVGALRGPVPHAGMAVEVSSPSARTPATVVGLEVMRVWSDFVVPDTWPRILGAPVGLLLAGVTKDDVAVGAVIRPRP